MNRKRWLLAGGLVCLILAISTFFLFTLNKSAPPTAIPPPRSGPPPASSERLPNFPWPPPASSAKEVLPRALFADSRTFGDVDGRLRAALDENGYGEKSYYAVPQGFALVTRLEQIESDGRSKQPPDRWSAEAPRMTNFSLRDYLRALFTAFPGHYRVIVFVLTEVPFAQSSMRVTKLEALDWLREGFNVLPLAVSQRLYTTNVDCTALIYEFEQEGSATHLLEPSGIDAHTHLVNAGLWGPLNSRFRKQIRSGPLSLSVSPEAPVGGEAYTALVEDFADPYVQIKIRGSDGYNNQESAPSGKVPIVIRVPGGRVGVIDEITVESPGHRVTFRVQFGQSRNPERR